MILAIEPYIVCRVGGKPSLLLLRIPLGSIIESLEVTGYVMAGLEVDHESSHRLKVLLRAMIGN